MSQDTVCVLPAATAAPRPHDVLERLEPWHAELRAQFPILAAHPGTAYLDSAATAQKPDAVLHAVHEYLTTSNANAGRGTYPWANRTTALLDAARDRVRTFLDDPEPDRSDVHLVSGTTAGLRSIALDWLVEWLRDGDEIVVPFADHQANAVPWVEAQQVLARRGVQVVVHELPYDDAHDYDHVALAALVTERTRFVAVTHVHHVYGMHMNVDRIRRAVGPDVVICLDAAQGVGHLPLSVAELDVDLVVFSGHKAMALPGTGAVWSRGRRGPRYAPGGGTARRTRSVPSASRPRWTGSPRQIRCRSTRGPWPWRRGSPTACST